MNSFSMNFKLVTQIVCCIALIVGLSAEARDKGGDDIILSKGKIIMRGGKDKGNIILDPGSQSSEHHSPMPSIMSMMSHFNPYAFYPMHQHQHFQPPMMIHPIYMEDHSAMHHQHEPEQAQHMYHHEEPAQYQHHHEEYHQQHHQYEPQHQEMQHHHHQPMEHQQHQEYEAGGQEGGHQHEEDSQPQYHGQESGGGGGAMYEGHPLLSMMMHGSGLQPVHQMQAMQAYQTPATFVQHPDHLANRQQQMAAALAYHQARGMEAAAAAANQQMANNNNDNNNQFDKANEVSQAATNEVGSQQQQHQQQQTSKPMVSGLLAKSVNNPLVQMIKPLFKWNKESASPSSSNSSTPFSSSPTTST